MSGDKSNKYATFVTLPTDLRIKYYTMYFQQFLSYIAATRFSNSRDIVRTKT